MKYAKHYKVTDLYTRHGDVSHYVLPLPAMGAEPRQNTLQHASAAAV